uniref:Uncharacterized protein n=1 Tax=Graphocephala atropunctata TaxID=36148 RepID=A0A1B6LCN6_9HEMI
MSVNFKCVRYLVLHLSFYSKLATLSSAVNAQDNSHPLLFHPFVFVPYTTHNHGTSGHHLITGNHDNTVTSNIGNSGVYVNSGTGHGGITINSNGNTQQKEPNKVDYFPDSEENEKWIGQKLDIPDQKQNFESPNKFGSILSFNNHNLEGVRKPYTPDKNMGLKFDVIKDHQKNGGPQKKISIEKFYPKGNTNGHQTGKKIRQNLHVKDGNVGHNFITGNSGNTVTSNVGNSGLYVNGGVGHGGITINSGNDNIQRRIHGQVNPLQSAGEDNVNKWIGEGFGKVKEDHQNFKDQNHLGANLQLDNHNLWENKDTQKTDKNTRVIFDISKDHNQNYGQQNRPVEVLRLDKLNHNEETNDHQAGKNDGLKFDDVRVQHKNVGNQNDIVGAPNLDNTNYQEGIKQYTAKNIKPKCDVVEDNPQNARHHNQLDTNTVVAIYGHQVNRNPQLTDQKIVSKLDYQQNIEDFDSSFDNLDHHGENNKQQRDKNIDLMLKVTGDNDGNSNHLTKSITFKKKKNVDEPDEQPDSKSYTQINIDNNIYITNLERQLNVLNHRLINEPDYSTANDINKEIEKINVDIKGLKLQSLSPSLQARITLLLENLGIIQGNIRSVMRTFVQVPMEERINKLLVYLRNAEHMKLAKSKQRKIRELESILEGLKADLHSSNDPNILQILQPRFRTLEKELGILRKWNLSRELNVEIVQFESFFMRFGNAFAQLFQAVTTSLFQGLNHN